ncbi:MAG TPA: hypothetical protein VGQ31_05780 [Candidatus Limnocylindrales bacterium]|jgi:hypothetical protein|nr:hypothetical protein [Candidatus Limnocylindrales bacterium]
MRNRLIIAAVLVLVGAVWMLQGLGILPGNGFMDRDTRWAVIGAVIALVGAVVAWMAFRARRAV